jgi:hypothetical protein
MRSRNVILSLLLMLALLAFTFMKVRFWEPKKKPALQRNPSRIEYSQLALCRMDCRNINANDITELIKNGEVNFSESDIKNKPCPLFIVQGLTKKNMSLRLEIIQCGRVAKVIRCSYPGMDYSCNCPGESGNELKKVSKHNFPEFFSPGFSPLASR